MSKLKQELEEAILVSAPFLKKETYKDFSTKEIIESVNQIKNNTQNMLGVNKLEDLPLNTSREEAIAINMKLCLKISKRLVKAYKSL